MRQPMRSTGPACEGPDQADQSLASLAAGKADHSGQARQQVAEAQSNLEQAAQDAPVASRAVALRCFDGAGRTDAVAGFAGRMTPQFLESIATGVGVRRIDDLAGAGFLGC